MILDHPRNCVLIYKLHNIFFSNDADIAIRRVTLELTICAWQ